eukprot:CAMPEP_0115146754 /NCGR_PEP_ID=MMETSP0227-20121206/62894_1 /TAXON_ID=89957 /ORGANISM="Polarella glacialis, Strain CCMP 1383" /LENGTH=154 /DNA_ID=CAMNT_0002556513 /DNA_START=42 /DNA_END=503 /DNA_ORIENTATION=+
MNRLKKEDTAMKRTSGQAYLKERDDAAAAASGEGKKKKKGWTGAGGGFADFLQEPLVKKIEFESLMSSECSGGRVIAKVVDEETLSNDLTTAPRCSWWQLQHSGPPVGPVESNQLDLSKLDAEVALVAQVIGKETINDASSNAGYTTAKPPTAW